MSRFWANESDSEPEVESEYDSEEEAQEEKGQNRFLLGGDDDSSEDEERVVRSKKAKKFESIQSAVKSIQHHTNIKDWNGIHNDYEDLTKKMQRSKPLIDQYGTPSMFYKALVLIEKQLKTVNKATLKTLNASNAKAYNIMKQKMKRIVKEHGEGMDKVREKIEEEGSDVDLSDDEEDAAAWKVREDGDDEEDDDKQAAEEKPDEDKDLTEDGLLKKMRETVMARGKRGEDRNQRVETLLKLFEKSLEFSKKTQLEVLTQLVSSQFDLSLNRWEPLKLEEWTDSLKNVNRVMDIVEENPDLLMTGEGEELAAEREYGDEEGEDDSVEPVRANLLGFIERLDDEWLRGLQNLQSHSPEYVKRLQHEHYVLDLAFRVLSYYKKTGGMLHASRVAGRILEHIYFKTDRMLITGAGEALQMAKDSREEAEAAKQVNDEDEEEEEEEEDEDDEDEDDEEAAENAKEARERRKKKAELEAAKRRRRIVYGTVQMMHAVRVCKSYEDVKSMFEELTGTVYKHGDKKAQTRTMLRHIFHLAIHDHFHDARDLLLMGHFQETIHEVDVPTQILFNRTMVQLGLCAFRRGLIYEAHSCLAELCSAGTRDNTRERLLLLLAQGISMALNERMAKNATQLKEERARQVPYHMHINLELIEATYLTTAMLLEVPLMAILKNQSDIRRRLARSAFRRRLEYSDNQNFSGPPENMRDHVMAAAKALRSGDWKECANNVTAIRCWSLLTNSENVKEKLIVRIKEESLRTYLFSYGAFYDSISLEQLESLFELPPNSIHSVVSKMMINGELNARWDQPTATVVMHRAEPSRLQSLAQMYSEKMSILLDSTAGSNDRDNRGLAVTSDARDRNRVQRSDRGGDRFRSPANGMGIMGRAK